jgi:hypothetical protein
MNWWASTLTGLHRVSTKREAIRICSEHYAGGGVHRDDHGQPAAKAILEVRPARRGGK